MRVYLPATVPQLRQVLADGDLRALAGGGWAVTPTLVESYASGDAEELEHVAQVRAGLSVLALLAADVAAPRRRAVVAADVDDDTVTPLDRDRAAEPGTVAVPVADVPLARVAAFLVDEDTDEVRETVGRALAEPEDDLLLGDVEDLPLLWFATQELAALVIE